MVRVKFEGIDDWNRPVFKDVDSSRRFGSLDILFDYSASEKEVLDQLEVGDLCYFGNSFDCEPMGAPWLTKDKAEIVQS